MSLPESTTVLIVGAGPSGVATALSLIHHGCRDFVIVDAVLQGQNASRALVIHPATLEALNTIGCAQNLVERGLKANGFSFRNRSSNSDLFYADFTSLSKYTPYPHMLIISQTTTERVLEEKLESFGVSVIRPCKVTGMQRNKQDNDVTDVSFEDGRVIKARYVIGADGARSAVRTISGIGFADPNVLDRDLSRTNILTQMVLADVYLTDTSLVPDNHAVSVLSPDTFFIISPIPTKADEAKGILYRIACGVPLEMGTPPHAPPKEYLQNILDKFGPKPLKAASSFEISEVLWSTRFRTHSAIADTFFKRLGSDTDMDAKGGGGILLVGDAAHIHSPAGGQGMNLGLRDAVAMGEAMSAHIEASQTSSSTDDHILRGLADSRHATALEVIALTKSILGLYGLPRNPTWNKFMWWCPLSLGSIRDYTLWMAGRFRFVRESAAWQMSGLGRR
ncbi:hypothetical protein SERLA73DRAFT_162702 [Serpula lacrymans var. lacrymans S7.3]|uniref:FAD-binding domain-containing protein n=2 Tax=Serpula lacrymans var. lacrymans TaxID=341189 RepID=F8Q985_SERL3|nr:uncharacterized protein SERLADRAFT_441991 [Serpula lacrymans var. lacrymans S7.9]EGN95140.1 hypothetical protein SERLA73DRAFT_162702 [Serpula lacrymans var. lacrymans S7.3]EGO20650.1 hypothetical protein SERLADRAFT_441991 [Serpula lacrymans var. lacrymans S7.9]